MRKISLITYPLLIFLILFVQLVRHSEATATAKAVLWYVKPYIFFNEATNRTEGIIIDAYANIKDACRDHKSRIVENLLRIIELNTLKEFDQLFEGPEIYGAGNLSGLTNGTTVWLPAIKEYNPAAMKKRGVIDKTLFYSPSIAAVFQKSKISLFYKLQLGIINTQHIVVISVICAIIFAILIWLAERWNNPEFGKSFTFGFGTGLWWAFVTMTTVGYGDIVPRSFVGRCITAVWMIIGLVSASLMTAAVSNIVLGVEYLDLREQKIAAITSSYEAYAIVNNYKSEILGCNSYEEVLEKVQNGEAFAGIMSSDIAGHLAIDIYKKDLVIPFLKDISVPVKVLEPPELYHNDTAYMKCVNMYMQSGIETATRKYRKFVQEETLYIETLSYFFSQNEYMIYYSVGIAVLIGIGIIYDMVFCGIAFRKKRKDKANKGVVIGNNNTELKEMSTQNGGGGEALWRNGELQKMRQDIMAIKNNITKINAMTKYKKTCNVCAWQR